MLECIEFIQRSSSRGTGLGSLLSPAVSQCLPVLGTQWTINISIVWPIQSPDVSENEGVISSKSLQRHWQIKQKQSESILSELWKRAKGLCQPSKCSFGKKATWTWQESFVVFSLSLISFPSMVGLEDSSLYPQYGALIPPSWGSRAALLLIVLFVCSDMAGSYLQHWLHILVCLIQNALLENAVRQRETHSHLGKRLQLRTMIDMPKAGRKSWGESCFG